MGLPTAAWTTKVYLTAASSADTNEACSFVSGSGTTKIYQVTSTAKRVWDPSVAIVVQDGGVTVSATLYSFNYLFGVITFNGHAVTGAITVASGNYVPIVEAVLASKWKLSIKSTLVDTSNFDGGGAVTRTATLVSAEGSFETYDVGNTILDGGSETLQSLSLNQTAVVVGVLLGTGNSIFRCWAYLESLADDTAVADVVKATVNWKSLNNLGLASFGWGT